MKGKKRGRGNVLSEYRRLQREIRTIFDPFTARHCPTCVTPCCIKPSKVTPVDVAMVVGMGHSFPHLGTLDPFATAVGNASHRLSASAIPLDVINTPASVPDRHQDIDEPAVVFCEFLDRGRCSFPNDLRPFGCTTFICGPMYQHLPDETIRRLRRLIRQLETVHVSLIHALQDAGRLSDAADYEG